MSSFDKDQLEELHTTASLCDLLGPVSHELQNYLNGIVLHAGIASGRPQENPHERMQKMRELAMKAGKLLQQLDEYRHSNTYPKRAVDIGSLLEEVVAQAGAACDIDLTLSQSPIEVQCNPVGLHRLLWMLIVNAQTAAGAAKQKRITIELSDEEIRIEDFGCPPEQDACSLMDDLNPSRKGAKPLWLSGCHSLAKRLGLLLEAQEAPGKGVRLTLKF